MGNFLAAKVKAVLWNAVRSDKVRPFIWVYYIPLLLWGVYGTFFAGPATYVGPVMGRLMYDAWIWLHLIGPVVVMSGLAVEDHAEDEHGATVGIVLQGSGHAGMFWVLLIYEISALSATYWGQGTYSIFALAPYVAGCLLLTVQCVVKVLDGVW